MRENWNPHMCLVQLSRKQFGSFPPQHTHGIKHRHSNCLLRIYPKELETDVHKNLYANVYSSIIHNSQIMETIQMSINLMSG